MHACERVTVCRLQAMEGSMLTLSLANWMELPGLKLKEWMRDKRRCVPDEAASQRLVHQKVSE